MYVHGNTYPILSVRSLHSSIVCTQRFEPTTPPFLPFPSGYPLQSRRSASQTDEIENRNRVRTYFRSPMKRRIFNCHQELRFPISSIQPPHFLLVASMIDSELLATLFIVISGSIGLLFALYQRFRVASVKCVASVWSNA